ncbi:MAG: LytTR family DNA-binding domain-containing protein [Pyrinomonadaceae bacterium]
MGEKKSFKILIADDERPARGYLRDLLEQIGGTEIVAEAVNGLDAAEKILLFEPDLALLDMSMPLMNGIEVVQCLSDDWIPDVAFVTAHDDFAVTAFELDAIDYLLKPVELERLKLTIERARERRRLKNSHLDYLDRLRKVAESPQSSECRYASRIPLRISGRIMLIEVSDLASVEADGELLSFRTIDRQKHVVNRRLKEIEEKLDPEKFIRVSRSAIVKLDLVSEISPGRHGSWTVTLSNGDKFGVSRGRSAEVRNRLMET